MQLLGINYNHRLNNQPTFKQNLKINPSKIIELIDNSRNMYTISTKTGIKHHEFNELCLSSFGKTYKQIKKERYEELIKIANSGTAKKLWIYELYADKLQRSTKLRELNHRQQKDAIKLWARGNSIESIATAIRAQKEEVFAFLAKRARNAGPIVG